VAARERRPAVRAQLPRQGQSHRETSEPQQDASRAIALVFRKALGVKSHDGRGCVCDDDPRMSVETILCVSDSQSDPFPQGRKVPERGGYRVHEHLRPPSSR